MEVFNEIREIPNLSLALGFFDGVHLGHKEVISHANAVVTFKKSPAEYFGKKDISYLTTLEQRREKIAALGVEYMFELSFTPELANMTAEEYLENLVKNFSPKRIVTGFNHTFGKNKIGTPDFLRKYQSSFEYIEVPSQTINGVVISSTQIKKYLESGEIEKANEMLGYDFTIKGTVIKGKQIGRTLGFPTANLRYPEKIVEIPSGVYHTKNSVTNYGTNPTIPKNENIVETHILGFDGDLYGQEIEVSFIKRIRGEKKFDSLYDLKQQIAKDIEECSK